ncbi:MAG: hypothetical protein KF729_37100 [Sandaracinaceae bacterium]|nr:hypothetical protein [Sandaracinaceae bacterium]
MRASPHLVRSLVVVSLGVAALAVSGCASRAYVRPGTVYVQSAPPPARVSVRPMAPYAGAVWVDGHYEWDGYQYVWVDGHYVQPRAGYTFVQPRWVNQGGRYVYHNGGWGRGGRVVHYYNAPRATVYRGGGVQVQRGPVYRGGGVTVRQRGGGQVYRGGGPGYRGGGVRVVGPRGGGVVVRP